MTTNSEGQAGNLLVRNQQEECFQTSLGWMVARHWKRSLNDKAGLDLAFELGVASLRRYGVIRFTRDLIAT